MAGGEIAVAGAGGEFAFATRGNNVYLDGAEGAVFLSVGGIVAEGVLVADIASDLVANVVNVVDTFRKECDATGGRGNIFQGAHGFLTILFVLIAKKTDGVNDNIRLLNFAHGFFKRVTADVVFTVGDHKQNLFVLVAFFQMIERADDGVIERGAAARVNAFEGFLEFGDTAGEILVEIEVVVVIEIDDEGFVVRIGSLDESQGGFIDAGPLVAHGAAIVNDQAHADRNIFALEERKFLFAFVFEDAEILFFKAVDKFAAVIEDCGVKDDQADVNLDGAALLVDILIGRRRPRVGEGERIILGKSRVGGEKEKSGEKNEST